MIKKNYLYAINSGNTSPMAKAIKEINNNKRLTLRYKEILNGPVLTI